MKRAHVAALWIATIVVTWLVVRGQTEERTPASEPTSSSPARSAHVTARPRPVLERRAAEPVDRGAFERALAALEQDMADGRWTIADRDRLNASTPRISGKQAVELYKVLFPKLNSGEVKSEIEGPPI